MRSKIAYASPPPVLIRVWQKQRTFCVAPMRSGAGQKRLDWYSRRESVLLRSEFFLGIFNFLKLFFSQLFDRD
jgi:hypothetical protein